MAHINGREVLFSATVNISEDNNGSYEEGFNAGKEAGEGALWDNLQNDGNREDYTRGFAYWGGEQINPKHKVAPTGGSAQLFYECRKLKSIDATLFDLSQATYHPTNETSAGCGLCEQCRELEVFPDIGLQAGCYGATWGSCLKLHTIEIIRVTEDCTFSVGTFRGCRNLQNILNIEGVFGQDIWLIQTISLTIETAILIFTHLKNYAGTESVGQKIIALSDTMKTLLTEAGALAELDGKTYDAYIADKGWNLA